MNCYAYLIATFFVRINGHSWLVCTDYTEKNARLYDPNKCRGFPRAANQFLHEKVAFGQESGYSHQPVELDPCRVERDDSNYYDSRYPMAVYYPGQQVVLAHPMKGHGADIRCSNPYIPDTGSWIFRSQVSATGHMTLSQYRRLLVFDLGVSPTKDALLSRTYPKPGFQNGPSFCANQDKSLATYSFNVPVKLTPGRYSFMWLRAFNNHDDLFSTCFEVDIVSNQLERNRVLQKRGFQNFTEPCGGVTSNPAIKGACNMQSNFATIQEGPRGKASNVCNNNLLVMIFALLAVTTHSFVEFKMST